MNFSVMYTSKDDAEGRVQITTALSTCIAAETDLQNALRASITLGNLAHENEEIGSLIKALGIQWPAVDSLQAQASDDVAANKKTINEIKAMLLE